MGREQHNAVAAQRLPRTVRVAFSAYLVQPAVLLVVIALRLD